MKQNYTSTLRRTLSAVLLLLLSTLTWAQDYDFESGVIRYSINEDAESVTAAGYTQECSGDVVVPSTVDHEGKTYRVTGIGESAFYRCTSLASIDLPKGLTDIGRAAFGDCTSLTSIDIPYGVTSIGQSAFFGCSSLTSVDLPGGLTSIERQAFSFCTSLTTVICRAEDVPKCGFMPFSGIKTAEVTLYVPEYALEDYKAATTWKSFGTILPIEGFEAGGLSYSINGDKESVSVGAATQECSGDVVIPSTVVHEGKTYRVTGIAYLGFSGCTSLTSISLPEGLTSIGVRAFGYCRSLTSVDLPEGLTNIGASAFRNCTSLASVDFPEGLTSIGNLAFGYCSSLTSVDLPKGLTSIGQQTFEGCSSLASVDFPEGLTSIEIGAFAGCTSLTSVDLPEGLTSIAGNAFDGCNSLASIDLPEGLTNIGASAFRNCTSLASVDFPEGLTSIGIEAFYRCTSLTSIDLPEGLTSIESGAFYDCTSLTSIDIPEGVTSIVSGAFSGCSSLTSVTVSAENPVYDSREGCNAIIETETNTLIAGCNSTVIPSSVTSIGASAFSGCTSLTSIDIPESVTSIGEYAFSDCTSLTSIDIPEGVTSIGEKTFRNCTSLASVDLPSGLTSIGSSAFYDCTSLVTVICRAEAVPVCGVYSVFSGCPTAEATLYVPASALEDYKAAYQWKYFGTILPLDDYETGIDAPSSSLESGTVAAPYYSLDGRRVTAPVRGGVYVRGGRKVIVR